METQFFIFSLIPLYFISQISTVFVVDKVQKFRTIQIVKEIEDERKVTGVYPDEFPLKYGLQYGKIDNNKFLGSESFSVKFERGFFVTETYDSYNKKWTARGWND